MLVHVHPENPQERHIDVVVDCLRKGGVVIYPTDTIYGLGCDIFEQEAIKRICRLKKVDPRKAHLSFICYDLSHLSDFAKQLSRSSYRLLKEYLPGPYTFILPASKQVPKILQSRKETIGLRIPDNKIARCIVKQLGHPILSATLPGEAIEEYTDPEIIDEKFANDVDIVVDGGIGGSVPSTIIDCTGDEPSVIRQGAGGWQSR